MNIWYLLFPFTKIPLIVLCGCCISVSYPSSRVDHENVKDTIVDHESVSGTYVNFKDILETDFIKQNFAQDIESITRKPSVPPSEYEPFTFALSGEPVTLSYKLDKSKSIFIRFQSNK